MRSGVFRNGNGGFGSGELFSSFQNINYFAVFCRFLPFFSLRPTEWSKIMNIVQHTGGIGAGQNWIGAPVHLPSTDMQRSSERTNLFARHRWLVQTTNCLFCWPVPVSSPSVRLRFPFLHSVRFLIDQNVCRTPKSAAAQINYLRNIRTCGLKCEIHWFRCKWV